MHLLVEAPQQLQATALGPPPPPHTGAFHSAVPTEALDVLVLPALEYGVSVSATA